MAAEALGNFLVALGDLLRSYGGEDAPDLGAYMPLTPTSASVLGPLDLPTLYPAVNKSDEVRIAKVDEDQQRVFGWASVSMTKNELVVDSHNDVIEPGVLEEAVYDFVPTSAGAGEMHQGGTVGRLIESVFINAEKAAAMGLPAAPDFVAWWVGFQIDDPEVFAKVKDGTYPAFSIQGMATREDYDE